MASEESLLEGAWRRPRGAGRGRLARPRSGERMEVERGGRTAEALVGCARRDTALRAEELTQQEGGAACGARGPVLALEGGSSPRGRGGRAGLQRGCEAGRSAGV